ncbi:hypothetical protein HAX54_021857 [Datura stramonium]|uniref:Uncharacterized protein n=1 Tax=Datura stramonium TaxID=4076 RepID=A0ABS8UVG8_DATST|nr:hypothetical protein [Datura stramonium]
MVGGPADLGGSGEEGVQRLLVMVFVVLFGVRNGENEEEEEKGGATVGVVAAVGIGPVVRVMFSEKRGEAWWRSVEGWWFFGDGEDGDGEGVTAILGEKGK